MNDQPNFLLITTDQQRWDSLGCAGNPHVRTPFLDQLAREGLHCTRAYPVNPICMPARASLLTGRSQRGHQVFEHEINLSEAIPVLGDSLREAGYSTALIGKAHFKQQAIEDQLPDTPPAGGTQHSQDGLWHGPYFGFDHVTLCSGHAQPSGHWRVWLERHHPEGIALWQRDAALQTPTGAVQSWKSAPLPAEWHHTQWLTERTRAWLRQRRPEQPFFCWLSYPDPHHPFCPPQPYCDLYDPADLPEPITPHENLSHKPPHYRWQHEGRHFYYGSFGTNQGASGQHAREIKAHYYGMISFVDEQIGRVLATLDQLGLRETTHVIFTSDHGDALLDHQVFGKPPLAYESILRVPLLWRHPPLVRPGRVHEGVMTQLDFVPTVLDLASARPLPGMEGRSFAQLLQGLVGKHREAVIVERIALERLTAKPVVRYKMLITERWKLVHYGSAHAGELYDLQVDPEQHVNLWSHPAHGDHRQRLTERLLSELIDSELGDAALIWRRQQQEPFGALRDLRRSEKSWPGS